MTSSAHGIGAFPNIGAYHASKWALEGTSEALAQELAPLGIKVTLVEPGGFSTDWAGDSSRHSTPMPESEPVREAMAARRGSQQPGDPVTAGQAILDVVDADEPPLRVLFGSGPIEMVKALYAKRLETWDQWSWVSHKTQGD